MRLTVTLQKTLAAKYSLVFELQHSGIGVGANDSYVKIYQMAIIHGGTLS
jgi:hypothetical protein